MTKTIWGQKRHPQIEWGAPPKWTNNLSVHPLRVPRSPSTQTGIGQEVTVIMGLGSLLSKRGRIFFVPKINKIKFFSKIYLNHASVYQTRVLRSGEALEAVLLTIDKRISLLQTLVPAVER